jgi:predicted transcriptional regulator
MAVTTWKEVRESLCLTPEEESVISLEKALISAVAEAREQSGLTQKQLSELCGIKQPVIARLESAAHSPQVSSILRVLRPLGYTLAVVKEEQAQG